MEALMLLITLPYCPCGCRSAQPADEGRIAAIKVKDEPLE